MDRDGCLDAAEFSIAMHLVHLALEGTYPPPTLPPPLAHCVEMVTEPKLPEMEDKHVIKCQTAFIAFKADIATGTLGSEEGGREEEREGGGREEGGREGRMCVIGALYSL